MKTQGLMSNFVKPTDAPVSEIVPGAFFDGGEKYNVKSFYGGLNISGTNRSEVQAEIFFLRLLEIVRVSFSKQLHRH